ncbi:hypothetical protein RHDC3_00762 [Rhodocyclaceae bacterium]|nr:hypothetical protein RHDC3_00762 [Rhodocyclaceae bacterium]
MRLSLVSNAGHILEDALNASINSPFAKLNY